MRSILFIGLVLLMGGCAQGPGVEHRWKRPAFATNQHYLKKLAVQFKSRKKPSMLGEKGRAPASVNSGNSSEYNFKQLYFLTMYSHFLWLQHFTQTPSKKISCPVFHHTLQTSKYDFERFSNDLVASAVVKNELQKNMQENLLFVEKELEILCEDGLSSEFYLLRNFREYAQSTMEDKSLIFAHALKFPALGLGLIRDLIAPNEKQDKNLWAINGPHWELQLQQQLGLSGLKHYVDVIKHQGFQLQNMYVLPEDDNQLSLQEIGE